MSNKRHHCLYKPAICLEKQKQVSIGLPFHLKMTWNKEKYMADNFARMPSIPFSRVV